MRGWLDSLASVNTIAMRVVSAATTNGPRSFRKLSTSDLAAFCSVDLFSSLGTLDILSGQTDADRGLSLFRIEGCQRLMLTIQNYSLCLRHPKLSLRRDPKLLYEP